MNIFYLSHNPEKCAQQHVDKHCVKMILETAQLLSTAHRVLDGEVKRMKTKTGRWKTYHELPGVRNNVLYSSTHVNHPSAIWARKNNANYNWLWSLMDSLCKEYTYRYGKVHKCEQTGLLLELSSSPKNIPIGTFTEPTPAMPDQYKVPGNSILSYHNYYNGEKQRMFSWKKRETPEWIV